MGNDALRSNPTNSNIDITTHASDWLWAVFAVMLLSNLAFIFWASRQHVGRRVFHHIPIMILTTASIAYFCMASDLGSTPISVQFIRHFGGSSRPTRAIWYVRYIFWTITTPLLLLELLLGTGLPLSDIVMVIFMGIVMVISGLIGALVTSSYKWGFFTFGCAALIYVCWILLFSARRSAVNLGLDAGRAYRTSAIYLAAIFALYPIAWGLSEGGNVISPTGEMIFYGILDILSRPVFCAMHVFALRKVPYELYQLQSGKSSHGGNAMGAGERKHGGGNNMDSNGMGTGNTTAGNTVRA